MAEDGLHIILDLYQPCFTLFRSGDSIQSGLPDLGEGKVAHMGFETITKTQKLLVQRNTDTTNPEGLKSKQCLKQPERQQLSQFSNHGKFH